MAPLSFANRNTNRKNSSDTASSSPTDCRPCPVPFVSKEGWLTKQGNFIKNWRPRWFKLAGGCLYYFKDPATEVRPTNCFVLAGCSVIQNDTLFGCGFQLQLANGLRRFLSAKTPQERDDWMSAIMQESHAFFPEQIDTSQHESPQYSPKTQSGKTETASTPKKDTAPFSYLLDAKSGLPLCPDGYEFLKVLGRGNFGKVVLARSRAERNPVDVTFYAIKIIKLSTVLAKKSSDRLLAEKQVMKKIDHPFLIKMHTCFQTRDRYFFVMEYASGGEIYFHISREKTFTEERVRFYAAEIVLAIEHLHEHDIVYRDLKLENIMLDAQGHIKLTDFGLCKEDINSDNFASTFCGTPEYLAPEIVEDESYTKAVDWWALGVVLYEFLVGRPPFVADEDIEQLYKLILRQKIAIPSCFAASTRSLLCGLLTRDPVARLGGGPTGAAEIKEHAFFKGLDWKAVQQRKLQPPFLPEKDYDLNITEAAAITAAKATRPTNEGQIVPADSGQLVSSDGINLERLAVNFETEFTSLPVDLTPASSITGIPKGEDAPGGEGSRVGDLPV